MVIRCLVADKERSVLGPVPLLADRRLDVDVQLVSTGRGQRVEAVVAVPEVDGDVTKPDLHLSPILVESS